MQFSNGALWTAFRHAAAKHPGQHARVESAARTWGDTPTVKGFSEVGAALRCAERAGVGALYLDALGDVAEVTAIQDAEATLQVPATPEDESYVSWVMAQVRAAPEKAWTIVQTANKYAPSTVAAQAVQAAVTAYLTAAREAAETTLTRTKEEIQNVAKAAGDKFDKGMDTAQAVFLFSAVALAFGTLALWKST